MPSENFFYCRRSKQARIIPSFRRSHLILFPATAMSRHLGVSTMEVNLLCRSLTMFKLATQPASHPCVRMQWMVVERRDHWPTRSHSPLSAQRSTGTCNSSNDSSPSINRLRARRRAMFQIEETRVGGETVSCRIYANREGRKTSIRWKSNSRREFDVVMGQGLLHGGWVKRESRSWVSFALWSGAASSNDQGEGGGKVHYSKLAWFVLPFLHRTPYLLCSGRLMDVISDPAQSP